MLMNEQQVQTLMEALPYLSNFKDKTIVVKYGGNAMLNDELKNKVLQDILLIPGIVLTIFVEKFVHWE